MARRFRRKKIKTKNSFSYLFWTSRLQVLQGMSVKSFTQIFKVWQRRVNIKSYLTPKVDSILNLPVSITTQLRKIPQVFRAKVDMFTPFFGDRPWNLAHVFYEPYPALGVFLFTTEILDLLRAVLIEQFSPGFSPFFPRKTGKSGFFPKVWRFNRGQKIRNACRE